eukprot:scaffold67051_cov21-Tisochrysis_lutea.AAC.1
MPLRRDSVPLVAECRPAREAHALVLLEDEYMRSLTLPKECSSLAQPECRLALPLSLFMVREK